LCFPPVGPLRAPPATLFACRSPLPVAFSFLPPAPLLLLLVSFFAGSFTVRCRRFLCSPAASLALRRARPVSACVSVAPDAVLPSCFFLPSPVARNQTQSDHRGFCHLSTGTCNCAGILCTLHPRGREHNMQLSLLSCINHGERTSPLQHQTVFGSTSLQEVCQHHRRFLLYVCPLHPLPGRLSFLAFRQTARYFAPHGARNAKGRTVRPSAPSTRKQTHSATSQEHHNRPNSHGLRGRRERRVLSLSALL
jgi:hypothetical protein